MIKTSNNALLLKKFVRGYSPCGDRTGRQSVRVLIFPYRTDGHIAAYHDPKHVPGARRSNINQSSMPNHGIDSAHMCSHGPKLDESLCEG